MPVWMMGNLFFPGNSKRLKWSKRLRKTGFRVYLFTALGVYSVHGIGYQVLELPQNLLWYMQAFPMFFISTKQGKIIKATQEIFFLLWIPQSEEK